MGRWVNISYSHITSRHLDRFGSKYDVVTKSTQADVLSYLLRGAFLGRRAVFYLFAFYSLDRFGLNLVWGQWVRCGCLTSVCVFERGIM